MARDAGGAIRFVVDVVTSVTPLLDVRPELRRRSRLGERHHRGDEQLHQTEQGERDDRRTRTRAERSSGSIGSVSGVSHWLSSSTYPEVTA
jgi:hypothetical protein